MAALLPLVAAKSDDTHLEAQSKQWQDDLKGYVKEGEESDPSLIHPQFVANMLDGKAADDAIFVSDVGTAMVCMLRHLKASGKRRFLNSRLHGTMANGFSQALGAKVAYPDRQDIAMCGDGGLTMLMGDMLALVQENIPLKVLVFHNNTLGFVEMEQRVEGFVDHFTTLHNPDFAKLAEACGIAGWHVDRPDTQEAAMDSWLRHDGPTLLDVRVNQLELVMSPKVEVSQVAGTALFGLKAVLDGRLGEVVALLQNNFLR